VNSPSDYRSLIQTRATSVQMSRNRANEPPVTEANLPGFYWGSQLGGMVDRIVNRKPRLVKPGHLLPSELGVRLQPALALLLKAAKYATDFHADIWQLAEEITELRAAGAANCDLRWLVMMGYALHASEMTPASEKQRSFRQGVTLSFSKKTCFVLTTAGVRFARELLARMPDASQESTRAGPATGELVLPQWQARLRQLSLGGELVKQFRQPAPCQEVILTAFEEEHWPAILDDPLPPTVEVNPRQRLHDAIRNLNRAQRGPFVRFEGDGSGMRICWKAIWK
jgi:hypothetical protein